MMQEKLYLKALTEADAQTVADYCAEFPAERMRVTYNAERIPGLDHLEAFESIAEWLAFCKEMCGKITWYMTVRERDGKAVGFICFRHSLAYDDDDPEFASHFGYSVRPSERRKGYAKAQLRLCLEQARRSGLETVRLVCRDLNTGSIRTILANGGVYVDTLFGEESGMYIERYDIPLV